MVETVMLEHEGARLVKELRAMDVSIWKIAKECGVSYQTGKAWARGWWNPDRNHTVRLDILKSEIMRGFLKRRG